MIEIFDISKVQIGLDLATSIALIASAIGVVWKLGTLSRKLQKQQLDATENQSKSTLIQQRQQRRVELLLLANSQVAMRIRNLSLAFDGSNNLDFISKDHKAKEKQIIQLTKECWEWFKEIETEFVAIGTRTQWSELQRCKRYFLQSVQPSSQNETVFRPKDMIHSLIAFQKSILIEIRTFLISEDDQTASEFIEENLDYKIA